MKELYLANMWPQIVTERGGRILEQKGYKISGNWLNRNNNYTGADRILLPYADFGQPISITEESSELWSKVVSYILFPDSLVGWNIEEKKYLFKVDKSAERVLAKSSKRLSSSNFNSTLADRTYGVITHGSTVPLGIDTNTIGRTQTTNHSGLRVLWNHMWRSDKGTYEAFDIISNLAPKYPGVQFWIGQTNSWNNRDNLSFRARCKSKLKRLQNLDNVKFFDRIKKQGEYWSWIKQTDISFSTAFQEGFGLSMMEQEAAGIACVVPNAEAYPELHAGCLIIDRSKLEDGLQFLIQSPNERLAISQSCTENASRYDISVWVNTLVKHLN